MLQAGYTVLYVSAFDLSQNLSEAEVDGNRKELIEQYTHTDLLVIEDFGMRRLPVAAAEDLLEIFVRRYEKGSIIVTSNRPLEDWGKLLGDNAATGAILDRFLHHADVISSMVKATGCMTEENNIGKSPMITLTRKPNSVNFN